MKKLIWVVLLLLTLGIFSGSYLYYFSQLQPVSLADKSTRPFVVNPGMSAGEVIDLLKKQQIIKSDFVPRLYLKINRLESRIIPGYHDVSPSQSFPEIITVLTSKPIDVKITIPEGWRREQIAEKFFKELAAFNGKFSPSEFLSLTATLEGQLFPDTYLVPTYSTAPDIVSIMINNFRLKSGLSLPREHDALVMASLIEREAKADPDRAIIAGILWKRLKADWPLQVDASVQYALGNKNCLRTQNCDWWAQPQYTDIPSVYNTYLKTGLPPGPVCNPGLASIIAANHPQTSPYWYYLTGHDGITYFARNLREHQANIDKYL